MIYTLNVRTAEHGFSKPFKSVSAAKRFYRDMARNPDNAEVTEAWINQKTERGDCMATVCSRTANDKHWKRNPHLG